MNEVEKRRLTAEKAAYGQLMNDHNEIWSKYMDEMARVERVCRMLELLERQPNMRLKYGDDDKLEPVEAHGVVNGYHCLISRHPEGHYTWYAQVPESHPWYGVEEDLIFLRHDITWRDYYPACWADDRAAIIGEDEWWIGQSAREWETFENAFDDLKALVDLLIKTERREA